MAKKDKYLVGLDIGSTKTSILIAEIEGEFVKFLALGAAESKGLRKGLIVNLDATVSSIRRAVEEAEGVANVPVEEALIGVAGNHVRGANSRGGIALGPRPRDIEREDVRRAVDAARNISLPEDREVLHVLPHEFIVDAQDSIRDPVGMVGQRLVANVHVVTSSIAASQNLVSRRWHDGNHRLWRRSCSSHRRGSHRRRPFHQRSCRRLAHAHSRGRAHQAPPRLGRFFFHHG